MVDLTLIGLTLLMPICLMEEQINTTFFKKKINNNNNQMGLYSFIFLKAIGVQSC